MSASIRITKLQRDERGFFTANVTAAGEDTVQVDTAIGCWTLQLNRTLDPLERQTRREVLPWCVVLLNDRVRAFERGEAIDENAEMPANARQRKRDTPLTLFTPKAIGATMAQAALTAVKEAA